MSTNGLSPYENNRAAMEGRLEYLLDHERTLRNQLEITLAEQYELYCRLHERRECSPTPET